ncbi:MAG: selenide, water dikinase SelD [Actinomycetota bacterium]|nr:selenide, water dikinase SelD [Actinomycetota bacterium]
MSTQQQVRLTSYSHGGGCACKLGISELSEILAGMKTGVADPRLLVGLETPDDAAVYELTPEIAIVQTVDFFTPIVDDAYSWGRIAAANALSDIYAMGGRPVTALNLVAWPRSLGFDLLGEVLAGGASACDDAGVSIVGGHSIDDPEPKYGLAVTGVAAPRDVTRAAGAEAGCDLVLTKPLGTGIISSAIKEGKASDRDIERAIASMSALNASACTAMLETGVQAATDVTGFGLVGHLVDMLGDRLSAVLDFGAIPLLPGALQLAGIGVLPGGTRRNIDSLEHRVRAEGIEAARFTLLFDAQTSGGLLIAVDPGRTEELLDDLKGGGVDHASVIGRLIDGDGSITVSA